MDSTSAHTELTVYAGKWRGNKGGEESNDEERGGGLTSECKLFSSVSTSCLARGKRGSAVWGGSYWEEEEEVVGGGRVYTIVCRRRGICSSEQCTA